MSKLKYLFLPAAALLLSGTFLYINGSNTRTFESQFEKFTDTMFQNEITASTLNLHYTLENPEDYGITNPPVTYGNTEQISLVASASPSIDDYRNTLHRIPYNSLSQENQLTYDILSLYLENEKTGENFPLYYEPLGATIGIQAQLPILLAEYVFYSAEDIDTYLELIAQTDAYFSSILEFEKTKSAAGLFMNDTNVQAIISQCDSFLSMTDEDNFLITIFNEKVDSVSFLSEEEKSQYKSRNQTAVTTHVMPAYQLLSDGLTALKGSCKNPNGLCYFPQGKTYYEYLLRCSTGSYLPVAGIEKRIRQQLAEDLTAYRKLLLKYSGTSQTDLFAALDTAPVTVLKDLQNRMTADFPSSPNVHYEVKYVHESLAEFLSPAFYLTPPIDNLSDHVIYINPAAAYEPLGLYTTLAHEGYPGHLYQNVSFDQQKTPVRSLLNFGGYTEGWATYVEMESYRYAANTVIAAASDAAQDPAPSSDAETIADHAELNRLNRSVMLGISSLLDICIHYHGFTLEDTREFLGNLGFVNTASADAMFHTILESPANYLKYYLGYLTFTDLRSYFQEKYPEQFNLKKFHEQILSIGPCQFPVLEKYLKTYYE